MSEKSDNYVYFNQNSFQLVSILPKAFQLLTLAYPSLKFQISSYLILQISSHFSLIKPRFSPSFTLACQPIKFQTLSYLISQISLHSSLINPRFSQIITEE